MNEEEKKAIERIDTIQDLIIEYGQYNADIEDMEYFSKIKNLIEKQQKELDKLKNKNKDLLRKLRNRVKQVKKLEKYALYKKEFSRLNKELEKKDREIQIKNNYLDLIWQIGYDYDGLNKVESLKELIDELVDLAAKGIKNDDKSEMYMGGKNILFEQVGDNNE